MGSIPTDIIFTGNGIEVFRLVRDQEIGGSNPPCPKTAFLIFWIIKALFFVFFDIGAVGM